jgi:hypothetical protein
MSPPRPGNYQHQVFVGSSRRTRQAKPTVEGAIENGYEAARKVIKSGTLTLRVVDIFVIGRNPITEYRVVLAPDG